MKKLFHLSLASLTFAFLPLAQAAEEAHAAHSVNTLRDIIYPWINFVILLSLLIYFLRKPAKDFFLARSKKVAEEIEQSAHEKHEAEARYLNYDRKLKNIESEMDKLLQSLKEEGELTQKKIVEEAKSSAKRIAETTQWIVNQEIRKAKEELKQKAVQIISAQAEQMVRQNVQAQDRQHLMDKALNKLEASV